MRKALTILLLGLLVLGCMTTAMAQDDSRSYIFALAVDGTGNCTAEPGEVITVTFTLHRNDTDGDSPMYAMQNEIAFDNAAFELVEGSELASQGIRAAVVPQSDGTTRVFMNFLSTTGGEDWPAQRTVGSFQLRVIAEGGTYRITNENCLVSTPDGRDTYRATAQDVTVVVAEAAPQPAAHDPSGPEGAGWAGFALGIAALIVACLVIRYLRGKLFPKQKT